MDLIKWNPFKEIEDVMNRYRRVGDYPFQSQGGFETTMIKADWSPRVDIAETDQEYIIKAEIPEVKKEDIKVTIENGMLTIQGERKQEKAKKGKRYHRVECCYGTFSRSFRLPENVDESGIKADYQDAILTLTLPKSDMKKTGGKEIKIG
jgi:HSP20 family protein